ncbi:hypothetical protein BaRGS_00008780, partial [Batillaria attramentaria]
GVSKLSAGFHPTIGIHNHSHCDPRQQRDCVRGTCLSLPTARSRPSDSRRLSVHLLVDEEYLKRRSEEDWPVLCVAATEI